MLQQLNKYKVTVKFPKGEEHIFYVHESFMSNAITKANHISFGFEPLSVTVEAVSEGYNVTSGITSK